MKIFDGPGVFVLIAVVLLLFGSKRLPDVARGVGRSLRIFKAETKGLLTDEEGQSVPPAAPAQIVAPPVATPTAPAAPVPVPVQTVPVEAPPVAVTPPPVAVTPPAVPETEKTES